jgi:hypothetical protein
MDPGGMKRVAAFGAGALLGLAITAGLFAALAWSAQAADCALAHLGHGA